MSPGGTEEVSFGSIARVIAGRRHVYTTLVTGTRWLLAIGFSACFAVPAWLVYRLFQSDLDGEPIFRAVGVPLSALGALVIACGVFMLLYTRARLIIAPDGITLRRRGMGFGRPALRTWRLDELDSVGVGSMETFHIGGSTPQFHLMLSFTDGERLRFGGPFDDFPSTERAAQAIAESARLVAAPV